MGRDKGREGGWQQESRSFSHSSARRHKTQCHQPGSDLAINQCLSKKKHTSHGDFGQWARSGELARSLVIFAAQISTQFRAEKRGEGGPGVSPCWRKSAVSVGVSRTPDDRFFAARLEGRNAHGWCFHQQQQKEVMEKNTVRNCNGEKRMIINLRLLVRTRSSWSWKEKREENKKFISNEIANLVVRFTPMRTTYSVEAILRLYVHLMIRSFR